MTIDWPLCVFPISFNDTLYYGHATYQYSNKSGDEYGYTYERTKSSCKLIMTSGYNIDVFLIGL